MGTIGTLLVLVGIAAVVVMGQTKATKVAKVVEAEKFVLIDKKLGLPNATLETSESGMAGLFLYGPGGKEIIAEMSASYGSTPRSFERLAERLALSSTT